MERSVTPWRVLDDEAGLAGSRPGSAAPDPAATTSPAPRAWVVVGGIAAAAALAVAALGLVVAGPTPVAIVQTGAAPVVAGMDSEGVVVAPATGSVGEIVVHVAGAVRRPGVVRLASGSRVGDAIEAAGGLGPRVDATRLGAEINLAARVADGDRIIVPSRDDGTAGGAGAGAEVTSDGGAKTGGGAPIDLNSASADALESLPGIGEVTAARIIESRTERPFTSLDELLERKVVGPATLAKIRDLVVVR